MAISASIQALLAGEQVAGSRLDSKLLDELLAEGLLLVVSRGSRKSYRARDMEALKRLLLVVSRGSRKSYRARDAKALKRFLIDKDESFRIIEANASDSRATMAAETGNSKLVMVRSCPGFPVNSYEPIECFLDENPFVVNPQEGSFLFVSDWEKFTIPEDTVVIGVENMDNFRMIRRQRTLFDRYLHNHALSDKVLFVSRYPQSTDLRKWLCTISNHYLHFGDFDLAE